MPWLRSTCINFAYSAEYFHSESSTPFVSMVHTNYDLTIGSSLLKRTHEKSTPPEPHTTSWASTSSDVYASYSTLRGDQIEQLLEKTTCLDTTNYCRRKGATTRQSPSQHTAQTNHKSTPLLTRVHIYCVQYASFLAHSYHEYTLLATTHEEIGSRKLQLLSFQFVNVSQRHTEIHHLHALQKKCLILRT